MDRTRIVACSDGSHPTAIRRRLRREEYASDVAVAYTTSKSFGPQSTAPRRFLLAWLRISGFISGSSELPGGVFGCFGVGPAGFLDSEVYELQKTTAGSTCACEQHNGGRTAANEGMSTMSFLMYAMRRNRLARCRQAEYMRSCWRR